MLNIRNLRKAKGYKQTEFAKLLGVKNNTLSQYETGIRMPGVEILTKISKVLDCTVDDLINGKEK